jgi:hypothetical protein
MSVVLALMQDSFGQRSDPSAADLPDPLDRASGERNGASGEKRALEPWNRCERGRGSAHD